MPRQRRTVLLGRSDSTARWSRRRTMLHPLRRYFNRFESHTLAWRRALLSHHRERYRGVTLRYWNALGMGRARSLGVPLQTAFFCSAFSRAPVFKGHRGTEGARMRVRGTDLRFQSARRASAANPNESLYSLEGATYTKRAKIRR